MFQAETITEFEDPRIQPYRDLKRQWTQGREEVFIAEGEKVVRLLLDTHLEVISLLTFERWLEKLSPLLQGRPENIQVFLADKKVIEQLVGYAFTQGVLALAKTPPPSSLSQILSQSPRPHFFVAADGVNNTENIGTLVRNCVAFGAHALILGETSCPAYLRRAVRASMGTIFKIPEVQTSNLVVTLRHLQANGIRCYAAHPPASEKAITSINFREDCCIVFGSEGPGISQAVLDVCDECIAIPMHGDVDSLNVGSAAAVFFYEVNRQRTLARRAS